MIRIFLTEPCKTGKWGKIRVKGANNREVINEWQSEKKIASLKYKRNEGHS